MSIFAPQNVMGPAHRGNVIQQLAQGAAQNVMRRQKMKALLQHTAGQAAAHTGSGLGGGMPFRGSTMGHATGVHGATMRPPHPGRGGAMGLGAPMGGDQYPDAGPMDLPSLPDAADPRQSAVSTAPGQAVDPLTQAPTEGPMWNPPPPQLGPGGGGSAGTGAPGTNYTVENGGAAPDITQATALVPLGGGMFYDPATDSIRGGGGIALQSGNAQQSALAGRPV